MPFGYFARPVFLYILMLYIKPTSLSVEEVTEKIPQKWIDGLLNANYSVICKLQPNSYDCSQSENKTSIPRYYYDLQMKTCLAFDYYECPMSRNNFLTLFQCHRNCRASGYSIVEDENPAIYCRLQPDFGLCNNYYTRYFYDISTRGCKGFAYSGCGGNKNRFTSRRSCVSRCSAILGALD